jgi:hypothetical protein
VITENSVRSENTGIAVESRANKKLISGGLLRRLKASGDFEVNHLLRTKPGFHELDIEAFIQKLKSLAPPVNPADLSSPKYVCFAIVARGRDGSVEAKG